MIFYILLIGVILLAGCTQQPPANQTQQQGCQYNNPACTSPQVCQNNVCVNPTQTGCQYNNPACTSPQVCQNNVCVNPTTPPNAKTVGMDTVFKFDSVHSYTYEILSSTGVVAMNFTARITSDSVNGTAAWLQESNIEEEGVVVITKMWVDKATLSCLRIVSTMNYSGQNTVQETPCPTQGVNAGGRTAVAQVIVEGTESVTVPAGTFSTTKYSGEGVDYWVASGVPVPVKISFGSGAASGEEDLVSYS